MIDWVQDFLNSLTLNSFLLGAGLFLVTFAVSLGIVLFIVVRLPATYFQESHPRDFWSDRNAGIRLVGIIVKNIVGVVLVALGIVMSLPGVPGQGLLTVLLGIMLLDFPGKRRLEVKLVSRPKILKTINDFRHRFGKPPLVLDSDETYLGQNQIRDQSRS
jgi:hypothetical protein